MQASGFKKLWICPSAGHMGFVKYTNDRFLSFHYHIGGVAGSHRPYLDAKSVLLRKQKNKLAIVSNEDKLLLLLLHSVLDGSRIKPKYMRELSGLMRNINWGDVMAALDSTLNPPLAKKLKQYLQQNDYARIDKIIPRIQNNFKYGGIWRMLLVMRFAAIKILWSIWRATRNAPLVSFIGMDGTGKTTMTRLLKARLDRSLITSELIYTGRGRNNILPIQFFGAKYREISDNAPASAKKKINTGRAFKQTIIYSLAAPIFAFDLFLRYWLVIWPKRKTKQIVLTDRYSTDILLMNHVPMPLRKLLYCFLPKPTLTVYLHNRPEILCGRKPDHPLQDLYRQKRIFAKINTQIRPVKIKSDTIDATLNKISSRISAVLP